MNRARLVVLHVFILAICMVSNASATTYKVRYLSAPAGLQNVSPGAINDNGQIAGGGKDAAGYTHGIVWQPDGSMIDYGHMPNANTMGVYGINIQGQVVGDQINWSSNSVDFAHGFVWTPGSGISDRWAVSSARSSSSVAINDAGVAVGTSTHPITGQVIPVKWSSGGTPTLLPTLGGIPGSAWDINEQGQILGWSANSQNKDHACIWQPDGSVTDLGVLPGYQWSRAENFNNKAQAVGNCGGSYPYTATFWDSDGSSYEILQPGWQSLDFRDINDSGIVLGLAIGLDNRSHAFTYNRNTGFSELTAPGFVNINPFGINNHGVIVGYAWEQSSQQYRGLVFEPVPEPSCALAALTGLAGLGIYLRRRRT